MSRESFVKDKLGPWSSHPRFLDTRMVRWMWVSAIPLAAGIALFLAAWRLGAVTLASLVLDWEAWVPAVFSLLAVGFSFGVTVMLCGRASTIAGTEAPSGAPRHMKWWAFVLATGLVAGVAYLFSRAPLLTSVFSGDFVAKIRVFGYLLGTAPLFVLILWLEFKGRTIDVWGNADASPPSFWKTLRRILTLAGVFAGYVLPLVWIDRIADALVYYAEYLKNPATIPSDSVLQEFLRWMPFLRNVDLTGAIDTVASMAVLVPLGCMTFFVATTALWFFGLRATRVAPVPADEVARAQGYELRPSGETWWDKALGFERPKAKRWVSLEEDQAAKATKADKKDAASGQQEPAESGAGDSDEGSGPPAWVEAICKAVQSGHSDLELGKPHRAALGETSELSNRTDLNHLFLLAAMGSGGGRVAPTKDQVAALEQFDKLYEEFQRAEDREGRCVFPPMDMLVSGTSGSGRTTLLFACALHAVVLRGHAVLVLVSSPQKAEVFVDRLRDVATRSGVGWYVAVSLLQRDEVLSWADPAAGKNPNASVEDKHCLSPNGALPDILVGTPHDYERLLFGADSHHAMVRRSLLRMQCVLVEDVSDFAPTERRHLPFLVDKHRLVLGGEHLPVQFLAVTPEVTENAADYLYERLFRENQEKVHAMRLRPCKGPSPWVLDLAGDKPAEILEEIAEKCADGNLDLIVWRPGVTREECAKLASRLGREGTKPLVVSDLDEIHPDQGMAVDAAIYRSASSRHHTLALRSRLADEDAVILRVSSHAGLVAGDLPSTTLPVLPAISSEALFVAHLASGVRHLAPFTPIPRDLWARLGLRSVGSLVRGPVLGPKFDPYPGYRLVLDPPEPKARPLTAARDQEWAWVALGVDQSQKDKLPKPPAIRPVEMFRPLDRNRELRMNSPRSEVYLGATHASENKSTAAWFTSKEENLDRMDLAYADSLMHVHGTARFFPERIEEDKSGFRIVGLPYRDRGVAESYLPLWDVQISVPPKIVLNITPIGVAPSVMRWVDFRDPDAEARLVTECQFRLLGTFDECGEASLRAKHISLRYPTKLAVLLFGARQQGADETSLERDEQVRDCLQGEWSTVKEAAGPRTNGSPWPLLSLALTASLRERLPGVFDFCRVVAFRGPKDGANDQRAIVFFIEPTATRGTVWDVMRKLQLDAKMTLELLENLTVRLERLEGETHGDALRNLMVEAGVSFGASPYEGHAEAETRLRTDLQDALQLIGSVQQKVVDVIERRERKRTSARRKGADT